MVKDYLNVVVRFLTNQDYIVKTRRFISVKHTGIGTFIREDCIPFLKFSEFILITPPQTHDSVKILICQLESLNLRERLTGQFFPSGNKNPLGNILRLYLDSFNGNHSRCTP